MRLTTFLDSANDPRLQDSLIQFSKGIENYGGKVKLQYGYERTNADINIIFGSWKNRNIKHHIIKNLIVNEEKPFICLETPLIGRQKVQDVMTDKYYRVGLNGFLKDTGIFTVGKHNSIRWNKLKNEFNLNLKEWCINGDYILIVLQIPGDASLKGTNITKWAYEASLEIRRKTNKKILIRTPQLTRKFDEYYFNLIKKIDNIYLQNGTKDNLEETIDNAEKIITYSSGFAIESIIAGVPTFACSESNFTYDVCSNKITELNNPRTFDRLNYLSNLAHYQWNTEELLDGSCWLNMINILNNYNN